MMTARRKYPIGIQTFSEIIHGGYVYAKLYEQYLVLLHSFYSTLKSCDAYIRFAFLTGITRFGKLSVFSGLNNLKDISMAEEFAAICGFTDDEVRDVMSQDVQELADFNGMTTNEAMDNLKSLYDGYHFSRRSQGVYNPFSLLSNFSDKEFRNYWYVTGTPTFLIRLLRHEQYDLSLLQGQVASTEERLGNIGTAGQENVIAALYQSGYLTLKGYNAESKMYSLGFPNKEVEEGFLNSLLPY